MSPRTAWLDSLLARIRLPRGAHQRRGRAGERFAARHLKKSGYRLLARNLRTRHGELDLIALSPDHAIVCVEVKAGAANPHFPAEGHVTPAKQRKIVALAAAVARRHRLTGRRFRFDVIAVEYPARGEPRLRHHVGAFLSHI
ncbi:MAG: YraN family protein [Planctomycetota bacterium]